MFNNLNGPNSSYPDSFRPKNLNGAIFVFGSNLASRHGKGAAKTALTNFGAVYGVASGYSGQSYAIPTKDKNLIPLSLNEIETYVKLFVLETQKGKQTFFVTAVGCGLAGYSPEQIAPMFNGAINCYFPLSWTPFIKSINKITGFFNQYRFLDNGYRVEVGLYDGRYPSVVNAYEAAKTVDLDLRLPFESCGPLEAIELGKTLVVRDGLDELRPYIMLFFIRQKFSKEPLRTMLLDTGNDELINDNACGDTYWGVCKGIGQNMLGKIIMRVRNELQKKRIIVHE